MRFILLLMLVTASAQAAVTADISTTRLSGVAPLAVYFDAAASTGTNTTRPFLELQYKWGFGDPSAGTWLYGNAVNNSKNVGLSPQAAHVFETAGTYVVTLTVQAENGDTNTDNVTITVTDPNTVFSGFNTTCISTSGTFSGCPSGALHTTTSSFNTAMASTGAGKRLLFRGGETFTSSTGTQVISGNIGSISSYGSGKANIAHSGGGIVVLRPDSFVEDWRVFDLNFIKSVAGDGVTIMEVYDDAKDILFMRNDILDGFGRGVLSNLARLTTQTLNFPHGLFIVENDIRHVDQNTGFIASEYLAVMGNYLFDSRTRGGEHVMRLTHVEQGIISHNYFGKQLAAKEVLALRSADKNATCGFCGNDTEHVVISDNEMYSSSDRVIQSVGANNGPEIAHGTRVIIERNFMSQHADTPNVAQVVTNIEKVTDITVRNNVVLMDGWLNNSGISFENNVTNAFVYNNSCYTPDNDNNQQRCVSSAAGLTNINISNNLLYAPIASNSTAVSGPFSGSNNIDAATNPYSVSTINGPEDYALSAGSVAIDAGVNVPVLTDYTGADRTGANDVGAYAAWSGGDTAANVYSDKISRYFHN